MGCESDRMSEGKTSEAAIALAVETTRGLCAAGENAVAGFRSELRVPVFSCEGACVRGEIARLAAHAVAKAGGFARACHGEAFTVPDSAMAQWVRDSGKVVVIDGCFLRCHARVLRGIVGEKALREFDALRFYNQYTEYFDIDAVPERDRIAAAGKVAEGVLRALKDEARAGDKVQASSCCGQCC